MTTSSSSSSSLSSFFSFDNPYINDLGGLSHGSLFRVADSVDTSVAPGTSDPKEDNHDKPSYYDILTFQSFLYSPNLTWLIMAVVVWHIYPYPLLQQTQQSTTEEEELVVAISFSFWHFFQQRLAFNMLLSFGYIGFWHVTLYGLHWCHRPFVPNRRYKLQKVLHNMFYTTLGVLHWTAVEVAFVYCYRTGRLSYGWNATSQVTTTPIPEVTTTVTASILRLLFTLVLAMYTPSFRDIHFYVAHRLIHVRWLYKYIHAVHHRNIDVEPFSGLAMHPVEHLWYYTCYAPFLIPLSDIFGIDNNLINNNLINIPFLWFWMGFHTALSPAAAHSGWEDHFSADLLHYLHHRYCDCNYAAGINFDVYFGTYQASIKKGSNNSSNWKDKQQSLQQLEDRPVLDSKATLERWWKPEHPEYQLGILALVIASLWAYSHSLLSALPTAALITIGPAVWALILTISTRPSSSHLLLSWRKTLLAPFDKDPWWSLLLHFGLGFVLGVLPSTYLLYLVLS
ncbi:C-5 sterol desaturase [Nitzschia inconspicua]|uniref:C-5 sterol desaturase n=1 Tax=Nitzschia inconspicua TaxID=303405 RepID=A0A9K3L1Q3_9STRA|nr:C-5 sterol desaturase [Nitzschia inconspicua]